MFGKLTFRGGVHPSSEKARTMDSSITDLAAPEVITVPLLQHIGAPAQPTVKRGSYVKKGQLIAEPGGFVSAAVHAPVAGKVRALGPAPHPFGSHIDAIEIENDGTDEAAEISVPGKPWRDAAPQEIIDAISNAGIVGMGGAAFPAHVKLSPPRDKTIDTVIINGAECEPCITADYRLMLENPVEILTGALITRKCLGAEKVIIGIEDNKPQAIKTIKDKVNSGSEFSGIEVAQLATKYPQGGEKQLIKAVTKREVPSGGLPMDAGCVVHNVGTAFAINNAIIHGTGLFERVITVSGEGVEEPANLRVRIGTPFSYILQHCRARISDAKKIIMGGPMMGLAQSETDVPVIKSTSAILLRTEQVPGVKEYDCISCGNCVKVCPVKLVPASIVKAVEHDDISRADECHIMDCIECGSCAYACPSKINLVHFMKLGKHHLRMKKKQ